MGDLIVNEFFKMMLFGFRVIFNVLIPLIWNLITFITKLIIQLFQQQNPSASAESMVKRLTLIWTVIGLVLMFVFLAAGAADARVLFFPISLAVAGYFITERLTEWWVPNDVFQESDPNMGLPKELFEQATDDIFFDPARVDGVVLGKNVTSG